VTDRPVVLFLCVHNAGRSLAAKVLLDHYAQGRVDVQRTGRSKPFGRSWTISTGEYGGCWSS
jgi:protein-tyrosine-phosphatase